MTDRQTDRQILQNDAFSRVNAAFGLGLVKRNSTHNFTFSFPVTFTIDLLTSNLLSKLPYSGSGSCICEIWSLCGFPISSKWKTPDGQTNRRTDGVQRFMWSPRKGRVISPTLIHISPHFFNHGVGGSSATANLSADFSPQADL